MKRHPQGEHYNANEALWEVRPRLCRSQDTNETKLRSEGRRKPEITSTTEYFVTVSYLRLVPVSCLNQKVELFFTNSKPDRQRPSETQQTGGDVTVVKLDYDYRLMLTAW
jgi:hypothetical protein